MPHESHSNPLQPTVIPLRGLLAAELKRQTSLMSAVPNLSRSLQVILAFELARGNCIERIDQPAGTRCPLAVILSGPLDIAGFTATHSLPTAVDTWENHDTHYPLEAGYLCERTIQTIAGPLR